jgi:hypothetical protein
VSLFSDGQHACALRAVGRLWFTEPRLTNPWPESPRIAKDPLKSPQIPENPEDPASMQAFSHVELIREISS